MSEQQELKRSNKITTHFSDGVVVGTYYKTHEKLGSVRSDEAAVSQLGFVMPESVPATETQKGEEVTPNQKLEAFKKFLEANATAFGYVYDPIDRRPDGNKFPSRYTPELFLETANGVLVREIGGLLDSVQNSINTLVKNGNMPEGSAVSATVGLGTVNVQETYKDNVSLKYADIVFPVTLNVNGQSVNIDTRVQLISGQLKKPREFGQYAFSVTGIKTALVDGGLVPKVEKKVEEEAASAGEVPNCEPASAQA